MASFDRSCEQYNAPWHVTYLRFRGESWAERTHASSCEWNPTTTVFPRRSVDPLPKQRQTLEYEPPRRCAALARGSFLQHKGTLVMGNKDVRKEKKKPKQPKDKKVVTPGKPGGARPSK
jgi:hypothetical protein